MLILIITISVIATATLSGMMGMGGGMILMGVYGFFLPITSAMILHGVTQAASNGFRALFLYTHIRWSVLLPYLVGAGFTFAFFVNLAFIPSKALVFLLIGSFPVLALFLPRLIIFNITKTYSAMFCGVVVTAAQVMAGASGPTLDIFYIKSPLQRKEIVATKALTQTIGHFIKLVYYIFFVSSLESVDLPWWIYPTVVVCAIGGTFIGKHFLQKMTEGQFRMGNKYLIFAIGIIYFAKGLQELFKV